MKYLYTKRAAELSLADLGKDREFIVDHTYKYAGQIRNKSLSLREPTALNVRTANLNVSVWAKTQTEPNHSGWRGLQWDAKVDVWSTEE